VSLGRRALANTIANWIGLAFATLASLVLTPYLLHQLGNEQFGIFQICRQFILYLALFDFGMMATVIRFSSRAVAAEDSDRINELANSALVLFAAIASIGLVASSLVASTAPEFFRVDPAYGMETRWLFLGLGVWWALAMLAFPSRGLLIGHQRYGLLSLVTSSSWVITVAGVILLFELGAPDLRSVGLAFIASGVFQLVAFNLIAHRLQPTLRWSPRLVRRTTLKTLYGFGVWNMLFAISGLCLWSSDNIVIGRLLGPEAVPFYAIPFMLIGYVRQVGFGFSTVMTPVAARHLAQNDLSGLRTTLLRSTRVGLILTLATGGVLVVVAEDLLRLWLGSQYAASWVIYAYLWLSFWAIFASFPIHDILMGAGDIRWPAAISLAATSITLIMKALALGWLGLGVEAVALLNCVLVLPLTLVFLPWCACRLAGISLVLLYREAYLGPILAFIPVVGAGWLITREFAPLNIVEFSVALVLLASVYLLTALWTLDASERAAVIRMIKSPRARCGNRAWSPPRPSLRGGCPSR
jgi:O-antigen/teichoic acid export membrane protein